MALTLGSAASSYCTAAEFLKLYDVRTVGELVKDDGTAASAVDLAADANLSAALGLASGWVESACLAGERYAPADLTALAASATVGGNFLRSLVADLAFGHLRQRRGFPADDHPPFVRAGLVLEQLRRGARIFPFVETREAGRPEVHRLTRDEILDRNQVSSNTRIFGRRQRERPFIQEQ